MVKEDERIPDLLVRGHAVYSANLNAANPIGTVQSIEHTLRSLDKLAADQGSRVARIEKELADYQLQADRPFEHEERLKQLLARQAEIDSLLDLDKGDQQGAAPIPDKDETDGGRTAPAGSRGPAAVAKMAKAFMRASEIAIREMPITERIPPQTGQVTGRVVAKDEAHIAFATAPNSFFVVASSSLGRDIQTGDRVALRFRQGRASLETGRGRGR